VNGLLEGFCIDILDEIKTLLNFKYNISLVPDGKFGGKKTYGWTGMVRVNTNYDGWYLVLLHRSNADKQNSTSKYH
jgi:hypothetical protein